MRTIIRQLVLYSIMQLLAFHAYSFDGNDLKSTNYKVPLKKQGGFISIGARNTFSLFEDGNPNAFGTGGGGHFRLQVANSVNTEFFADVFTSNIKNKAHRNDFHVGWSVMYYFLDPKKFRRKWTPYVIAGHCFDISVVKINGADGAKESVFSSMVQTGIGCSYNVTPRFDLSLTTQYGFHLGKELDVEEQADGTLTIEKHNHAAWQGHLLVSISANYKIFKLWNRKK